MSFEKQVYGLVSITRQSTDFPSPPNGSVTTPHSRLFPCTHRSVDRFSLPIISLFPECHMSDIVQWAVARAWLLSHSMTRLGVVCEVAGSGAASYRCVSVRQLMHIQLFPVFRVAR